MLDDPVLVDWHPVASEGDLDQGRPVEVHLLGEDVVLWRATDDRVLAWQDLCVHRGTRLSRGRIDGATLECAYHGWTYDTGGHCVPIPAHPEQAPPARASVKTYRAMVQYGLVWVSLGEPPAGPPQFPEWHDPAYREILCGPCYPIRRGHTRVKELLAAGVNVCIGHDSVMDPWYPPGMPTRSRPRLSSPTLAR